MSCGMVYLCECPVLTAVIAGGNLCHDDNANNGVLASDEMIFIGRTSSCA